MFKWLLGWTVGKTLAGSDWLAKTTYDEAVTIRMVVLSFACDVVVFGAWWLVWLATPWHDAPVIPTFVFMGWSGWSIGRWAHSLAYPQPLEPGDPPPSGTYPRVVP